MAEALAIVTPRAPGRPRPQLVYEVIRPRLGHRDFGPYWLPLKREYNRARREWPGHSEAESAAIYEMGGSCHSSRRFNLLGIRAASSYRYELSYLKQELAERQAQLQAAILAGTAREWDWAKYGRSFASLEELREKIRQHRFGASARRPAAWERLP